MKRDRYNDSFCKEHNEDDCKKCPRYEYCVDWEHGKNTGWFYVGQNAGMSWGAFGDGISLKYVEKDR